MTEAVKPVRFAIPGIFTAILFAPAVAAGVFVGRSISERPPPILGSSAGSSMNSPTAMEREKLASCRERLATRMNTAANALDVDASVEPANEDAGGGPATVEQLEAEQKRCRTSELLTSAEICRAAGRQFEALMALPKDGLRCGPKSRAADLIEENFERCAVFASMPSDLRAESITKEQAAVLAEAIQVHRTLPEDELLRRLKEFVYTCTETPPKLPPGVKRQPNNDAAAR